jgi:hypothetical protein
MRTTLTLDDDVAQRARTLSHSLGRPFKQVVNEAMRAGLEAIGRPATGKPYRTRPKRLGMRPGISIDNIAELPDQLGAEARP